MKKPGRKTLLASVTGAVLAILGSAAGVLRARRKKDGETGSP